MATVLIVSKTQMRNGVCVGGIIEQTCELIRIMSVEVIYRMMHHTR